MEVAECIRFSSTGSLFLIDPEDAYIVDDLGISWYVMKHKGYKYVRGCIDYEKVPLEWMILGRPLDGLVIDHINGDQSDNRRENLRMVSRTENQYNQKLRKSSLGIRGVSAHGRGFRARIQRDRVDYKSPVVDTIDDAINERKKLELKHYGDFSHIN